MADAAHDTGEIPAGLEIPGVVRKLPGIGIYASGIEGSTSPPPLGLDWEGSHVLAALEAAERVSAASTARPLCLTTAYGAVCSP